MNVGRSPAANKWSELVDLAQRLECKTRKRIHVRGKWESGTLHVEKTAIQMSVDLLSEFGWEWWM